MEVGDVSFEEHSLKITGKSLPNAFLLPSISPPKWKKVVTKIIHVENMFFQNLRFKSPPQKVFFFAFFLFILNSP